jgi:hypothetical protein
VHERPGAAQAASTAIPAVVVSNAAGDAPACSGDFAESGGSTAFAASVAITCSPYSWCDQERPVRAENLVHVMRPGGIR